MKNGRIYPQVYHFSGNKRYRRQQITLQVFATNFQMSRQPISNLELTFSFHDVEVEAGGGIH